MKLRVVRIGNSPLAPLFEVLERPNNWDRQIAVQRRASEGERTEIGQLRFDFWSHLCSQYPELGQPSAAGYRAQALPNADAVVVQYLAKEEVGIFVRPPRGGAMANLVTELEPHLKALSQKLGAPEGGQTSFLWRKRAFDTRDRQNWDEMADWLFARLGDYLSAFSQLQGPTQET